MFFLFYLNVVFHNFIFVHYTELSVIAVCCCIACIHLVRVLYACNCNSVSLCGLTGDTILLSNNGICAVRGANMFL